MNNNRSLQPIRPRRLPRILAILFGSWLVLASLAVLLQRDVLDWLSLHNYKPSTTIAEIAQTDTLTPTAKKYLYVNHPSIDAKAAFTTHCSSHAEQTIVLGCYHGNQQGIYLLSVTDSRLHGVEEVTAAHEMLHAAYDRLSSRERNRINALLQNYYDTQLHDSRIRDTIDAYKKSEPNDVVNEMHSVFGTEASNLPPVLEDYYKAYFTNRAAIVALANSYANEFSSRRQAVADYDAQLQSLKATIDANNADLTTQHTNLVNQRNQLEATRNTSDVATYNMAVAAFNAAVTAYNDELVQTKQLVVRYNEIVDARNAIALEEQQLVHAISGDSVPTSTP